MEILIRSLSYTYPSGVAALQDVSLEIGSGESVAVIGQNGAGKTTLVKHLNGLLQPLSGQVLVRGLDTRQHTVAQMAAQVGYVFQNPDDQLFQSTVWAEVIFGPKNLGVKEERILQLAEQALKLVGLSEMRQKHPYDLSPSQRKKIALAAVLAMDTPVIILDEPTTGQDYASTQLVGEIVENLKGQGRTLVAITHDIDFCAEHFARVVVMAEGRVLLDGPAREVLCRTDILAQSYVEPPQLARLARRLRLESLPLNSDEFIQLLS